MPTGLIDRSAAYRHTDKQTLNENNIFVIHSVHVAEIMNEWEGIYVPLDT